MARPAEIIIIEIPRKRGGFTYEVSGTLKGKRIRERFGPDQKHLAKQLQAKLLAKSGKNQPNVNVVTSTFSQLYTTQLEHMEHRLKEQFPDKDLLWAADFALKNFSKIAPPPQSETIADVKEEYLDYKKETTAELSVARLKAEIDLLEIYFKKTPIKAITRKDLKAYLKVRHTLSKGYHKGYTDWDLLSLKSKKHITGAISAFWSWCLLPDCEYADQNVSIQLLPRSSSAKRKAELNKELPPILYPEEVSKLLEFAEAWEGNPVDTGRKGMIVPYIVFCLFAGIRPTIVGGEIGKLHSKSKDHNIINLDTDTIKIIPEISKTGDPRSITIRPVLKSWLEAYPLDQYPIIPDLPSKAKPGKLFESRTTLFKKDFLKATGIEIKHDILRHTFITVLLTTTGSFYDTCMEAGNSEKIAKAHYANRLTKEQANDILNVYPSKGLRLVS